VDEWWTAADRERLGAISGGAPAMEGEGKEAMVGMARRRRIGEWENDR
jgi:hypothetical protein